MTGLETLGVIDVGGNHLLGGIIWGRYVVIQQFPKTKRPRASKGWRRHVRRVKAEKRKRRG